MSAAKRFAALVVLLMSTTAVPLFAQTPGGQPPQPPAKQPDGVAQLPFLTIDAKARTLRIEAEMIGVDSALEFFAVTVAGPDHEAVLRSKVRPSDVHTGLLMLGLVPGKPVRYVQASDRWLPPEGPALQMWVEWKDGDEVKRVPAYRMMRDIRSKAEMPPRTWVFAGSKLLEGNAYAADVTGYIVSVVNFELTVIDTPQLASDANETLQWETNTDVAPARGTPVTLVIQPAGAAELPPAGKAAGAEGPMGLALVEVKPDGQVSLNNKPVTPAELAEQLEALKRRQPTTVRLSPASGAPRRALGAVQEAIIGAGLAFEVVPPAAAGQQAAGAGRAGDADRLTETSKAEAAELKTRWETLVGKSGDAIRNAAQHHAEVIRDLRAQKQRLEEAADQIQQTIDELEEKYDSLITPRE